MTLVTLHKVTRTLARRTRANWILRWYGTNRRRYSETIGPCLLMTKRDAEYARRKKQADLDGGVIQPNKPARVTLDQFLAEYPDRRRQGDAGRGHHRGAPRLSDATITDHTMTIRYMVHHFGGGRALDSISVPDADVFVDALAGGQLDAARKKSKRSFGMCSHTVRGHIRNVKAVFNWARLMGMVTANPFADFTGAPPPSKANHYVPLPDFERLLAAAPTHGWKVLYALCRLAGLRRGWSWRTRFPWAWP